MNQMRFTRLLIMSVNLACSTNLANLLMVIFLLSVSRSASASPYSSPAMLQNCTQSQVTPEELSVRKAAEDKNLSGTDILARLILSESLSTGYWSHRCNALSDKDLMSAIGWGILNRVQKRNETASVYNVVFSVGQFRTSFSSKKRNPFALAFLCPEKSQGYLNQFNPTVSAKDLIETAQNIAEQHLKEFNISGLPKRYENIAHFFYPKSEYFGEIRPAWAKNANPVKNRSYRNILESDNPCVEFYGR